MKTELNVNKFLRLSFWIFVVPLFLTVFTSKFIAKINIFDEFYSYSISPAFVEISGFECKNLTCTPLEKMDSNLILFKSSRADERLIVKAKKIDLAELHESRKISAEKIEDLLKFNSCETKIQSFIKNILITDLQNNFLKSEMREYLYNVNQLTDENEVYDKSIVSTVCNNIRTSLSEFIITPVIQTYEQEVSKLKIVLLVYFTSTVLAILIFVLIPKYRGKI